MAASMTCDMAVVNLSGTVSGNLNSIFLLFWNAKLYANK